MQCERTFNQQLHFFQGKKEQDLQGNLPVHKPQFLYLSEAEIAPLKNPVKIESNGKERVPNTGTYGEPPNHAAEPICEVEPASSFNESLSPCFFFSFTNLNLFIKILLMCFRLYFKSWNKTRGHDSCNQKVINSLSLTPSIIEWNLAHL